MKKEEILQQIKELSHLVQSPFLTLNEKAQIEEKARELQKQFNGANPN